MGSVFECRKPHRCIIDRGSVVRPSGWRLAADGFVVWCVSSIAGNVELSTHWRGNDSGCSTVVRWVSSRNGNGEKSGDARPGARWSRFDRRLRYYARRDGTKKVSVWRGCRRREPTSDERVSVSLSVCWLGTRTCQGALRGVCRAI